MALARRDPELTHDLLPNIKGRAATTASLPNGFGMRRGIASSGLVQLVNFWEEAMRSITDHIAGVLVACSVFALATSAAIAQDAAQVDAKHYKVTFENEQVRILRITYGPKEKSVMHEHPNSIAVFLADGQIRFTLADGKSQDVSVKAGESAWNPAGKHLPENMGEKPFEVVLIELKTK
jgi:quercetin dioxygenase-like cupin family protein